MAKKDLIKRADGSYSPRGLWDNIRAAKGSGKEPTKEMLAQEKKIKREMANGGKLSHFYPSNIQAYAEGGGIDLPKSITNGGIYPMPYYSETRGGANQAQYALGFGTAPASAKGGWNLSGSIGKEYNIDPEIPMMSMWQNLNDYGDVGGFQVEPPETGIFSKLGKPITKQFFPNPNYKGPAVNFNATYQGKKGLDSQRFVPFAEVGANYTPSSGLGIYGGGGGEFSFGKDSYRQGLIRSGYAAGGLGPHAGFSVSSSQLGPYYGLKGHLDYRPKFFGDFPGMLKAEGHLGISPAMQGINAGQKESDAITYGGKVGMYMPVQKLKQHMPSIDLSKMQLPQITLPSLDNNGGEDLQNQGGNPMGDFGSRYNASPIEARWNRNAGDIYIPSRKSSSNAEPIVYDPNDPEAVFNNQYSKGGAMNRNYYSMGGRAFADGGQLTQFTEGGSHEQNPLGGIPQGFAPDGKLNLVEQGETKLNAADYIFSDQIKVSKETASLYGLSKNDVGKTFAEVSKKANRPNSRRENDTIEQVAIQRDLENLMQAQEQQKETEKQEAIAEMQSKYPDLQIVDQAAMQQAAMEQPMADEAMMQQQQQMAPSAQAPQEMDPAMMAQMQQQGMMSYGGKMYNMGGHMYSAGGGMMALRGIGSAAYGIGEGLVDTLTFGLTDTLTDKGYEKLSKIGNLDDRQAGRLDAIRGFGNTAGAITGAVVSGGTATNAAISEGIEGAASGIAALPSTGEKADNIAKVAGQLGSMYGNFFGGAPGGTVVPQGALEGSKAASALMNAPQNKFITQGMNIANQMFANGGFLNQPTNGMFTNQFAQGGPEGEPTAVFNIGGTPITLTLSEALKNPIVLDVFETPEAIMEYFQSISPEARAASMQMSDVAAAPEVSALTEEEQIAKDLLEEDEEDTTLNVDIENPEFPRLAGETDEQYTSRLNKFRTGLDQKSTLESIKASPVLAGAMALPALYNIGRGIFGKVDKLDPNDYLSKSKISPYEMNIDPQLAETRRAFSTSIQAAKNAAPGGGSYLATLSNLASARQQAIKDLYAQKENFDNAQKLEADKFNAQVDQGNVDRDLAIQQYNAQARSAKEKLLETGLGQVAQVAEGLTNTDLQEAYLRAISPDFAGNFQYLSIPEQIAAATRKNKGQNS